MRNSHFTGINTVRNLPVTWSFNNHVAGRIDASVPMIQNTSIRIEVIPSCSISNRGRSATT